jgi:pilus assembly protein CpaF
MLQRSTRLLDRPAPAAPAPDAGAVAADAPALLDRAFAAVDAEGGLKLSRGEIARIISRAVSAHETEDGSKLPFPDQRAMTSTLVAQYYDQAARRAADANGDGAASGSASQPFALDVISSPRSHDAQAAAARATIEAARARLQPIVMARIDVSEAAKLSRLELETQLSELIPELLVETRLQLNAAEQRAVVESLLDEMLGLGPLEPLLADEKVSEVMINGARQVYVERGGKLELSDVSFRDNAHVLSIATRIVSRIGRRIDETQPLVDARLIDGSRVNIIIPPLALDGPSITIRKFSKKSITLDVMIRFGSVSQKMAALLKIAGRCRMNILISGGTGSGKTTLLNAISQMIDPGERVVTIEDAAELQLQQPHVVRLETRPSNIEGKGEITMRDLVKNSLRMRPDRIILGECRGGEAFDMLQAMNTGHDGSMSTIHANRPREALSRLENLVGMASINLPARAVRQQIAQAVHMIVQIQRMRDGSRKITHITELVGMEGEVITTQDLFTFDYSGESGEGKIQGTFASTGIRPAFLPRAEYYGLGKPLLDALS